MQNYNENAPLFYLEYVLAGYYAPFGTFLCACTFAVGRVINAIGYTSAADSRIPGTLIGASHRPTLLATVRNGSAQALSARVRFGAGLLASNVIDCLVLMAGLKAVNM